MENNMNTAAFIIAGGKSRRFGRDKALYEYQGKKLIEHVHDALSPVFSDIAIVSSDSEKYEFLGLDIIPDIIPDLGPVGGIYTALERAGGKRVFAVACDMPCLNSEFISYMLSIADYYDVIIPFVSGFYEPLHTIYSSTCLEHVKELINRGERKITGFFEKVNVRPVSEEEIGYYDDPFYMLRNINFTEDIPGLKGS